MQPIFGHRAFTAAARSSVRVSCAPPGLVAPATPTKTCPSTAATAVAAKRGGAGQPKKKAPNKSDLPSKVCATCGRPFTWRKKWAKVWDEVKYCCDRCRGNRPTQLGQAETGAAS